MNQMAEWAPDRNGNGNGNDPMNQMAEWAPDSGVGSRVGSICHQLLKSAQSRLLGCSCRILFSHKQHRILQAYLSSIPSQCISPWPR